MTEETLGPVREHPRRDPPSDSRAQGEDLPLRLLPAFATMAIVLVVLWPTLPETPYHWDEVQLAYGVESFDLARHHPHPPGYLLFLGLGRLIRPLVGGDALAALRWASMLAVAGFAGLLISQTARSPRRGISWLLAASVGGFALASPLLRFFGAAALPYAAEGVIWTALLFGIAARPRARLGLLLAFAVGLSGGLRQSLPLWAIAVWVLEAIRHRDWMRIRDLPAHLACLAVGTLAWLTPLLGLSGGWQSYQTASGGLLRGNIWSKSVFAAGLEPLFSGRLERMLEDLWMGLGPAILVVLAVVALRFSGRIDEGLARDRSDTLLLGALVPFVFYASMIYDTRGYMVSCVMAFGAYALISASDWIGRSLPAQRQLMAGSLLLLVMIAGSWTAPNAEFGVTLFEEYARHDREAGKRLQAVTDRFSPEHTVLVTSREYWTWNLRLVAYGLPQMTTMQLASDRFFAIVTPQRPYLASRQHRLWAAGPEGLDLESLLPNPSSGLEQVVYMVPFDVSDFIDRSCEPLLRGLAVDEGETLPVLELAADSRIRALDQRLVCELD